MLMPVQVQGIPRLEISGCLLPGGEYRNHPGAIHLVKERGEPFFQGFSVFFRKGFRQFILDFLNPGFSVTAFPYGRSDQVKIDTVIIKLENSGESFTYPAASQAGAQHRNQACPFFLPFEVSYYHGIIGYWLVFH
jgi:hypothetical protein